MVLTALGSAISPDLPGFFIFSAERLFHGWVWTPLTYVFVNPPSLWLVISSYLLWNFGEAVERHIGRWAFVKLLLCLLLATPLLLTILHLLGLPNWPAAGIMQMEFGVFLAFAALYPTAKLSILLFGAIDAWILATVLVAVSALSDLSVRNWPGLFVLAGQVGTAVGFIRHEQGIWVLPSLSFWPKAKPRSPKPDAPRAASGPKVVDLDDVDAILDKISRHGLASLTESERRTLEKASDQLGKRGKGR